MSRHVALFRGMNVGGRIYLRLPHGMARTKLPSCLDRRLVVRPTIRNWNTVTELAELAAG